MKLLSCPSSQKIVNFLVKLSLPPQYAYDTLRWVPLPYPAPPICCTFRYSFIPSLTFRHVYCTHQHFFFYLHRHTPVITLSFTHWLVFSTCNPLWIFFSFFPIRQSWAYLFSRILRFPFKSPRIRIPFLLGVFFYLLYFIL